MKDYVTGIQHIGIPTKDVEATAAFYQKIGFDIAAKFVNSCNGANVIFLQQGNCCIETYEEKEIKMDAGAIDHFSLDVTDVDAAYADIKAAGLNPTDIDCVPSFWDNGVRYFKIEGPNKEAIEFCQIV